MIFYDIHGINATQRLHQHIKSEAKRFGINFAPPTQGQHPGGQIEVGAFAYERKRS
jgi:hypothetical protein